MPKILVTPIHLNQVPGPYRDILIAAGLEVVYPPQGVSLFEPRALVQHLQGIDGVLASVEPFTREVLAATKLRAIARHGVGYDAIDVQAATEHGVAVAITPGTNEESVAELAIALMLGVYRGFPWRDREVRTGGWNRRPLPRMAGRTLGLVGLGRIGKAVARRAVCLDLKVIAHDLFADAAFAAQQRIGLCSLDELLAASDIVSLHVPVTPATSKMINVRSLAAMKRGAVLINTARGGLVDEPALIAALQSGHLIGAGLDVFCVEPLPPDSPLTKFNNVLLSPHMAGIDVESQLAMSCMAAQCLADLCNGRWPEGCVVNDELRAGWKA